MKRLVLIAALLAGSVGAAQAAATNPGKPSGGNDCVFISSVGQYRSIDRDKLVIWAPGRRNAYLVELTMPLFGLESSWKMAVIDHDHDGRLCSWDRIGVRDLGHPESATIRSITRLDDAQLEALEEQYHVSLTGKKKTETKSDEQQAH
jgi:hypothetical protein